MKIYYLFILVLMFIIYCWVYHRYLLMSTILIVGLICIIFYCIVEDKDLRFIDMSERQNER